MAKSKQTTKKNAGGKAGISDQTKMILLISTGSVLVIALGWWAYAALTTIAPPDLAVATSDEVVNYLGQERGFKRMNMDRREEFLHRTYARFGHGEGRKEFNDSLRRMSRTERQVFMDAAFELGMTRFQEKAREFNRTPPQQRAKMVDNLIQDFDRMRSHIAGYGPQDSVAEPFRQDVPSSPDGLTKAIVTRTNAKQRAQVQPLFDALAVRYKQMEENPG